MKQDKVFLVLSLLAAVFHLSSGRTIIPKNSIKSKNVEMLDDAGRFLLGWEIIGDEIVFEVEAETLGYVGFGISPQGGMMGADILIAGVRPDGTFYFSDRHGTGRTTPTIDTQADWKLISAMELAISGKTLLKFSRLLDTCDDQDYPIGNDTNRLIWALGATDTIEYHTANRRGSKSTNLFHADLPELDMDKIRSWPMTLDMEMPTGDTTYWCSFHKGPVLNQKHHVVGFEALLPNAEALQHTHHFLLYNCFIPPGSNQTLDEIFGNFTVDKGVKGDHCYQDFEEMILPIPYCSEYLYVWAKGGKQMVFPEHVGYPVGETPGNQYYMLEIHYDNPEELENVSFETGVQFFYTDELRANDAALLTLGHDITASLTVPPMTPDYKVVGHCSPKCFDLFPGDGITIFNSLLHSHLSGRKIKARHFRGNTELPWIDFDDHYDFDYQQNKQLMEEIKILKGDQITVECTYDSTWKNGEIVMGGMSTRDEMCESIVWYYPKFDIDVCGSEYSTETHMQEFGVTEYRTEFTNLLDKHFIVEPESLRGDYYNSISFKFNWTQEFIAGYTQRRQQGVHVGDCMIRKTGDMWNFNITYPENIIAYEPEDKCSATKLV